MTVRVEGLRELARELRAADRTTLTRLKDVHTTLARLVEAEAERRAPRRSGRLARSIKGRGAAGSASISGGGLRVPYFGVQEFGGSVPNRGRAGTRGRENRHRVKPYRGGAGRGTPWWDDEGAGYFFHPAARSQRQRILDEYADALDRVTQRAFPEA